MADVSQIVEFKRLTAGASNEPISISKPMTRQMITRASSLLTFIPAIKNLANIVDAIPSFIDSGGPNSTFSRIIDAGGPNSTFSRIINGGTL